jgi:hypothetical protein
MLNSEREREREKNLIFLIRINKMRARMQIDFNGQIRNNIYIYLFFFERALANNSSPLFSFRLFFIGYFFLLK